MECPECKKDLTQDFVTVYKLGLSDAEERVRKTIKTLEQNYVELVEDKCTILKAQAKLLAINKVIGKELLRLDQFFPLQDTPSIIIPLKKAKQIRSALPKCPLKSYLTKLMGLQLQNLPDLTDISSI